MAKTTHPLFSLAATGTIAGALAFRQSAGAAIAQRTSSRKPNATTDQTTCRDAWRLAAAAWRAIDAPTRAEWIALAATRSRPPFAQFAMEWRIQRIEPPALPLIPA
jgi:hypothetical protein